MSPWSLPSRIRSGTGAMGRELLCHLLRQALAEPSPDADPLEFGQLEPGLLRQFPLLAVAVWPLGVGLGTDRDVLPGRHRHGPRDEPPHPGQEYGRARRMGAGHPHDEAGRRHDAIVLAQDGGPQPPDPLRAMPFTMRG